MATKKKINLALQGGGAHGAFTWGVLDRLLEEDSLEIAAITGTSAGALNGAALKAGLVSGGAKGAKENLSSLWEQIGAQPELEIGDWLSATATKMFSVMLENSPAYAMFDAMSRVTSPYVSGPMYVNPLEPIVSEFSYNHVCADSDPEFFVSATNVRTGKVRVFQGKEITKEAIMASACLPTLFQAVEIQDKETGRIEAYWDGGYTGNPALFPLFHQKYPDDIVIVNINPLVREEIPRSAPQILNRINEISFNSSLLRELRAINFAKRLIENGDLKEGSMRNPNVHMIADDQLMNDLGVATKTVPVPVVLTRLRNAGRIAAEKFLDDDFQHVGRRSSVDLENLYG